MIPTNEEILAFMPATVAEMAEEFDTTERSIINKLGHMRKVKHVCFIVCWERIDADSPYKPVYRAGRGHDALAPPEEVKLEAETKPATPFDALASKTVSRLEQLRPHPRPPKKPRKPWTRKKKAWTGVKHESR